MNKNEIDNLREAMGTLPFKNVEKSYDAVILVIN